MKIPTRCLYCGLEQPHNMDTCRELYIFAIDERIRIIVEKMKKLEALKSRTTKS